MTARSAETLFGTAEVEPCPLAFAVGLLSFELDRGSLRSIRYGDVELLRAIDYRVRDRDWGTLAATIDKLHIDDSAGVSITYRATCTDHDGARLGYEATIVADFESLHFTVESLAHDDFTTSRLGFCILHPAELAGVPVGVEHGDGKMEQSAFPTLIDPWQPFTDIRALIHKQEGLTVECRLEGETFEMEDQRNWSDASYKTYVRPLALPWPYVVAAGTRNRQSVALSVSGTTQARVESGRGEIELFIGEAVGSMPRIGLVITPDQAIATEARANWLERSGVQDLLLTFNSAGGDGEEQMKALARAVKSSRARRTLECVLACSGNLDQELQAIADYARNAGLALDSAAVFPSPDLQSTPPGSEWPPCPPAEQVYAAARRAFPGLPLGGGMFGYFTEFNRKRPAVAVLDFVTHATCPIVHAADDLSVMQTLQTIPHIIRSARAIAPDAAYRLGPITIGMRQNPYGSRTMPNPHRSRVPMAMEDPRQEGLFAAAWTLGYVAATEEGKLDTLTLGALTGPFGLLGSDGPRPVFFTIAMLAELAGEPRRSCRTSVAGKVAAICAGGALLLANLTPDPVRVRLEDGRVASLDSYATERLEAIERS